MKNGKILTTPLATQYSQLPPCEHPAITDTPIIRTAAKSPAKPNFRHLSEINSRYYGLSLMRTLRACLHGGWGPQVGDVTRLGGVNN